MAEATNAWRIRFSRGELWLRFFRATASDAFFLVFDGLGVDFFVVPDEDVDDLEDGWVAGVGVADD